MIDCSACLTLMSKDNLSWEILHQSASPSIQLQMSGPTLSPASRVERCPAPEMISSWAPEILLAISWWTAGGVIWSSSPQKIRVGHWNVQDIRRPTKPLQLTQYMTQHRLHMLFITETNTTDSCTYCIDQHAFYFSSTSTNPFLKYSYSNIHLYNNRCCKWCDKNVFRTCNNSKYWRRKILLWFRNIQF